MKNIDARAARARETVRRPDGRFGEQGHDDPGQLDLDGPEDVTIVTGTEGGEAGMSVLRGEDRVIVFASTDEEGAHASAAMSRAQARNMAHRLLAELDRAEYGEPVNHNIPGHVDDRVVADMLAGIDSRTGGGEGSDNAVWRLYQATQHREAAATARALSRVARANDARYVMVDATYNDDDGESEFSSARTVWLADETLQQIMVEGEAEDELYEEWTSTVDRDFYGSWCAEDREAAVKRPRDVFGRDVPVDTVFVVDANEFPE